MAISLLLIPKIAELLLLFAVGFVIVKLGLVKSEDSAVLSKLTLYVILPCVMINAFQIERSVSIVQGLGLGVLAAIIGHGVPFALAAVLGKPLKLDAVEKCSIIYSNSGNMTVPIVMGVFGPEWVVYTCSYMVVQQLLIWSHAVTVLQGEKRVDIKKMLVNPNMVAIGLALLLFAAGIQIPAVPKAAIESVALMVGPVSMLVSGMLLASLDVATLKTYKKLPLILFLRLVAAPILVLLAYSFLPLRGLAPHGDTVLLISFIAAGATTANSVTQLSQLGGRDARYAGAISVVGTVLCAVTIPLLVLFYV